jgi:hypothetical protein
MQALPELPDPLPRYQAAGGMLDFTFFAGAPPGEAAAREAIARALPPPLDQDRLHPRPVTEAGLFGDWFDPASGALVQRGEYTMPDGRLLRDPPLHRLGEQRPRHGSHGIPAPGGQLAYAFGWPPYGLSCGPAETQALFDATRALLLPPGEAATILDWSDPALPEACAYFAAGAEWWGVFLATIHLPARGRLVVIAGSATD